MKRREFITLLGAAAAWPVAARAQQGGRIPRIGVLRSSGANDDEKQRQIAAFPNALKKLGWTEGLNVRFEYRYADGDAARVRRNAGELAAIGSKVILVADDTGSVAIQQETRTIPIVFLQVNDPLGTGLVANLGRPGGNITGFYPLRIFDRGKDAGDPEGGGTWRQSRGGDCGS